MEWLHEVLLIESGGAVWIVDAMSVAMLMLPYGLIDRLMSRRRGQGARLWLALVSHD